MTATKVNDEINDEAIRKLFEEENLVFLATLMKDGSPHNVSTWVDIEDGTILINTVSSSTKHKNISHDPRVALAITDQNNPSHTVSIRGKVIEQIIGDEAENHVDKLAKKYRGVNEYPGRELDPTQERVISKIKPEKIFHMNYKR
jgi:PPOX class probable F420-dependent enzyme